MRAPVSLTTFAHLSTSRLMYCPSSSGVLPIGSSAGPPPLYGTCTILTPVMLASSAPARCPPLPLPAHPYVISLGRDIAERCRCEIAVLRGANHAWSYRSGKHARISACTHDGKE